MQSKFHAVIVAGTIAVMAMLLVGGSVAAVLLGRDIPKWMEDAVILIIAAAFGASGFFAQTVQMDRQADALGHMIERNHELAMAGTTMTTAITGAIGSHAAAEEERTAQ